MTRAEGTFDLDRFDEPPYDEKDIDGDPLDSPAPPAGQHTTGVLVYSGGTRVWVKITHNHISSNKIGNWLSKPVTAVGLKTNSFFNLAIKVPAGH